METDSYLQTDKINLDDERYLKALIYRILTITDQTERLAQFSALMDTFGGNKDTLRAQILGFSASIQLKDTI